MREHASHVALLHDDAVVFACQAHVHAVDAADHRRAAADALAAHARDGARFVRHVDIYRVGVLARRVGGGHEFEVEPCRAGDVERFADAGVVGGHAQQARHERLVGSVAAVGVGEAAVQGERGLARLAREQATAHQRDA